MSHCAYPKEYLYYAKRMLALMCEYSTQVMEYELDVFWGMFLHTEYARLFEQGNTHIILGTTGIGLAMKVEAEIRGRFVRRKRRMRPIDQVTSHYWIGWALAYCQWWTSRQFAEITGHVHINEIHKMYQVYHCLPLSRFARDMNDLVADRIAGKNYPKAWMLEPGE